MNRSRSVVAALLLLATLGCQRLTGKPAPQASASSSAPSPSPTPNRPGAFDLASTDTGAILVTAIPKRGLAFRLLDHGGATQAQETSFELDKGTEIDELSSATLGSELGVVWSERTATGIRARGLVRPLLGQGRGPAADIGPMIEPVSTPRGNLAIGVSDAHFLVLARGGPATCVDPARAGCVGFDFFRVTSGGATKTGLPLAVPQPCLQNSVSFAVSNDRFYYGVCSQGSGRPVTTLFSIQNEPAYARADDVLAGCLPLGALADGRDLIVAGECGGTRRAVRVRHGNAEVVDVRMEHLDVVCEAGQPLIRELGAGGLHLSLSGRRDRLEAFLPDAFRMPQARAVWTGEALLVAGSVGAAVSIKSYRCDSTMRREVAHPGP